MILLTKNKKKLLLPNLVLIKDTLIVPVVVGNFLTIRIIHKYDPHYIKYTETKYWEAVKVV